MPRHRHHPTRTGAARPLVLAAGVLAVAVLGVVALRALLSGPVLAPAPGPPTPVLAAEAVPAPPPAPAAPAPAAPAPAAPAPAAPAPADPVPAPASACGAAEPIAVASGPLARVSICGPDTTTGGGPTYRATRASDGASVVLPAERDGTSWTATSGDVTYRLGDSELLITRNGSVLEQQVMDAWWERPG